TKDLRSRRRTDIVAVGPSGFGIFECYYDCLRLNLPLPMVWRFRVVSLYRDHAFRSLTLLCVISILGTVSIYAQDALRPSLAGEEAYEARQEDVSRIPYNLLLGPVRFRVGASVGVEYNDNVTYSEINTQDDVIVTPNLTLDAIWPVTQLNTLRFDIGIGYSFFLDHSQFDTDSVLIAPKSQRALDIF